jgi:hypothetical protein
MRRSILALCVAIGMMGAAGAAVAAPVSHSPKTVTRSAAVALASLPFNVRAEIAADQIVNADESLYLGKAVTPGKPVAQEHDSSIVGYAITARGLQIVVSGAPSAFLARAIAKNRTGIPVAIRVVPRSAGQLAAVQARIGSDARYWKQRGVVISVWGPDLASDKVQITLTHYSRRAAAMLIARYGAEWVRISTASATIQPLSRTTDSPPWWGGDLVYHPLSSGGTETCSTGFSIKIASSTYVPTADHCLESDYSDRFYNPGGGTIGYLYASNSYHDTMLIKASSAGTVWSDPNSTERSVTSVASSDPVGGLICADGAISREVCNVRINSTGQSVTYVINGTNTTVKNLVYACQQSGNAAFQSGDSGGPVETTVGSDQSIARGEILAGNGNISCGYYLPERYIVSDWGATVLTS